MRAPFALRLKFYKVIPQSDFRLRYFCEDSIVRVLYKDKNLIAISKDAGVPSQPDPTGDVDAMSLASDALFECGESNSLWLVHRLDRVVGGVIVFARNKKYAAVLSELAAGRNMKKEYLAVVEGEAHGGVLTDLLYKDSAKGKSFVVDRKRAGVKEAELEYIPLERVETEGGVRTLVKVELHTGRFHQIRAQFSHRGTPLVGDGKYGSRDKGARMPALFSHKLTFGALGREYLISDFPDTEAYPWSLFSKNNF